MRARGVAALHPASTIVVQAQSPCTPLRLFHAAIDVKLVHNLGAQLKALLVVLHGHAPPNRGAQHLLCVWPRALFRNVTVPQVTVCCVFLREHTATCKMSDTGREMREI